MAGKRGTKKAPARRRASGKSKVRLVAFDAGKTGRRLRSVPTSNAAVNALIRQYGKNLVARSRYLTANNPYAANAKEMFASSLVGCGIKPSPLVADQTLKVKIQELFGDWAGDADADAITDFYGLQSVIAAEMFEAGECFVRIRSRLPKDGINPPFQLQVIPTEMLPLEDNRKLKGGARVECGIEFDAIGRRVRYHFLKTHPNSDSLFIGNVTERSIVPAEEIMHLFVPFRAGQIRGIPHTVSAITTAAYLDCYEDAELERKRLAALFAAFVTTPTTDASQNPLGALTESPEPEGFALEPGAVVNLLPGEDIKFSEPADVGANYDSYLYRALLRLAAGFGVPYAAMTGDLRQSTYGSIRYGLVEFRRRIEKMQHAVMVHQFCRPVWRRFIEGAVAADVGINPAEYVKSPAPFLRVKWITPKWDWIDPLKDLQAEAVAVNNGFKPRSDVIESEGYDAEETDKRIADDMKRAKSLGLSFPLDAQQASSDDKEADSDKETEKESRNA